MSLSSRAMRPRFVPRLCRLDGRITPGVVQLFAAGAAAGGAPLVRICSVDPGGPIPNYNPDPNVISLQLPAAASA